MSGRRRVFACALALGCATVAPASRAVAAPRADTSPVAVRASEGIVLDGHGNGHGIGLSQWGAYGYAVDLGWSAAQILDHYYGGTVAAVVGPNDTSISVRLMKLDDQQTAVVHDRGQLVVDGVAGGPWGAVVARETTPGGYTVWARSNAACPSASDSLAAGWTVIASSLPSVTVHPQTDTSASADYADLLAVCEPSGAVRSYRGAIRAVNGTDGENRTVNVVPLEQYLRPIVATEMSASWAAKGDGRGAQALQAQAVAARSYGLAENKYSYAKTCDLTCQSYPGAAWRSSLTAAYTRVEQTATDAAVAATAGVVRRVGSTAGAIAYTMFSASSGGWTAASTLPFPAVEDAGDATPGNPAHSWSTTISAASISAAWPSIGSFTSASVTKRSGGGEWGGRVLEITIAGTSGSVRVSGDDVRRAFGLKSNWFAVRGSADAPASSPPTAPTSPPAPTTTPTTTPTTPAPTDAGDGCAGRVPPAIGSAPGVAPAARFQAIAPVRLIDTRDGTGTSTGMLGRNCTLVVRPAVGADATAVAVNITTVDSLANGFVTAYPCGVAKPFTASVQPLVGQIVGGTALVPLGSDQSFCIFSNVPTDVVVDLFGVYSPSAPNRFQPVDPQRRYDSRTAGPRLAAGTVVAVPVTGGGAGGADTAAVALTVHLTDAVTGGFVTAWPCDGPRPFVSAANVATGGAVTNHLEVAVGARGEVCFMVSQAMHLTIDLSGWFGPSGSTDFHAVTPFRLADTREGNGWSGPFLRSSVRSISVVGHGGVPAGATARAVAAQFTAVDATGAGYLTVDACRSATPQLSMLRFPATRNVAALVTGITTADGRWCVVTSATTQVVVDVTGWFG